MEDTQNENRKYEVLDKRLSDLDKGKLFAFNQDKAMIEAIKKALFLTMVQQGIVTATDNKFFTTNWASGLAQAGLSDEETGKTLKRINEAIALMEDGFKQIIKFGLEKVEPIVEKNPAI